jgi:hypothetical protein
MADLTAEFVTKILSLAPIETFDHHGLVYTSDPLNLINPPAIAKINVITLSALAALYHSSFEAMDKTNIVVHVTSEVGVAVYGNFSNEYAQRTAYAAASFADVKSFTFGTWLDQETFIIGLQAHVKDSGDRQYLLDLSSRIAINDQLEVTDNGVSQDVTAKTGTSLKQVLTLKPRVTLAPFRTFREIEQPSSEFVFRVRKGARGTPELALFEADGGAWKLTAMKLIAEYLTNAIANDAATVIY